MFSLMLQHIITTLMHLLSHKVETSETSRSLYAPSECQSVNQSLKLTHVKLEYKLSRQGRSATDRDHVAGLYYRVVIIDMEVSRLAIGFQKVCIIKLPQCTNTTLNFSTSTGSIIFKQNFHKSGKTYQLTNQSTCLLKPTKFLI